MSKELQKAALKHNLMLLTCGNDTIRCASRGSALAAQPPASSRAAIRFIPPLTVTAAEMEEALGVPAGSLSATLAAYK